ncbi:acyl-CoA carboxylase subunit beta [Parageobacillus sp. VR-IP]|jgi:methylmalonyl-CoA decarboxylase subunit alpha|uniref:Methylcrotonyl-CoA carboxylase carboxyl transferase subunit n=1 Tax=Saccharococcus caldoxylosilyticus TaxID=81408 RepID=A0A150LV40_9BACL|nr:MULTISPECIES: acyl-CoA carboxylase subunit beta [Parageobacillus]OQP02512.1 carboxylase [Geobacillus sp. 44B]KYD15859.1 Methylcrotonyl-CoA carboxylase carboxyl transferase subunit [Parageobacillus caldoxylosilyticus]NUK31412.1 acyl-CoA carboxylase subunit beta [Parageobacillus sp. VR-IP]QNU37342.1 acyl-CoA carboxylase subunit beta [Geobacillus sp. 44B]QXJ36850.1 Methylmalonyl-CoA carboxyltransferase 12S subunit [Parageobacillus caldoxylosilyticus]
MGMNDVAKKQNAVLTEQLQERIRQIEQGGAPKYHEKNAAQGKLFVRDRLKLLLDNGLEFEDALFANCLADGLPADGVVTGVGKINGQTVCVMANDSTVKAGSWGARTVEKIIRIQETAEKLRCPILYLVDSAGARITDQIEMFPGRRGAGRIFYNQVKLSGKVPQVCLLFGPSAAGGAYIPAFCDIVIMVEGNASMYLGSPRMAEMVIGEKVTLEEMGGARMHCTVSGCGDVLVKTEEEAIAYARRYLSYFPANYSEKPPVTEAKPPKAFEKTIEDILPANQNAPFNMYDLIERVIDEGSFCEIKKLFAPEIITGLARLNGQPIGIIANQPRVKGGVLFHDSADKAAKFITLCDAFNIPLLFLADIPGFMIGTKVERAGIIRHGAKMISAMSEATVPKISIIVRKAYGAGLYAMAGPAFEPDCCLAFPNAQIAVMGPEAAVNAVYANKIAELPEEERAAFVEQKREEYRRDIDIYRLASEMVVDGIIAPNQLRDELIRRFDAYMSKYMTFSERKHGVYPV